MISADYVLKLEAQIRVLREDNQSLGEILQDQEHKIKDLRLRLARLLRGRG